MRTDTTKYIWAHGRAPRGKGFWWFAVGNQAVQHVGSYADAKRAAVRRARQIGASHVEVLP